MHVPIEDGDALGAVLPLGMAGGDGGVVEEAEAHGPGRARHGGRAGAWPRRRCRRAGHDLVDGLYRAAGAAQGRLVGAGRHHRVLVDPDQALPGADVAQRAYASGWASVTSHLRHRRLLPDERREPLLLQGALDGADAVGALGMAERRLVIEAAGWLM